jgi:hypothetical protein
MSTKNWNNPDMGNVDQDNNAIESIITKVINDLGSVQKKAIYRENCGPSSLSACLESLGVDQNSVCGILQPEDFYACAMNDGKIIQNKYFDKPVNRYLEAYPLIIGILYPSLKSSVKKLDNEVLRKSLSAPDTACIINLINPGHFVAAFHIDESGIIYYNDSWLGDFFNPSPKHKRSIHIDQIFSNMKNGFIEIIL